MTEQRRSLNKEILKSHRLLRSFFLKYYRYTLDYLRFLSSESLSDDEQIKAESKLEESLRLIVDYHLLLSMSHVLYKNVHCLSENSTLFNHKQISDLCRELIANVRCMAFINAEKKEEIIRLIHVLLKMYSSRSHNIKVVVEGPMNRVWRPINNT